MNFKQLDLLKNSLIDWNVNYSVYPYNGYTINEVLCQFFDAINKGIVVINDYTKWVDELLKWVKTEGLGEEVKKELDKWLENGTLSNLINTDLLGNITTTIQELTEENKEFKDDLSNVKNDNTIYKASLEEQKKRLNDIAYLCSGENIGLCVNSAIAKGYKRIKIAPGMYELDESIIMKNDVELYGSKDTIIVNNLDSPIIKTSGLKNDFVSNCYIHDLHLIKNKPTNFWHMDLCNLNMSKVERVRCEMGGRYPEDVVGGLYVYPNGDFVGEGGAYSLCMDKLDFRGCSVKISLTDCYLTNSNIWGNGREYALYITTSSQQILNCQFVGGAKYGGVYIKSGLNYDIEIIKINNCYFDGSYEHINSAMGIYALKLRSSIISNNTFWRQKDSGIILIDPKANVINGNTFEDNGIYNLKQDVTNVENGIYDLVLRGVIESNVITNNTYASYDNFHIKPKCIDISKATTWNNNVFKNNIIFNNGHYNSKPFSGFEVGGTNVLSTNGCYGSWLQEYSGVS